MFRRKVRLEDGQGRRALTKNFVVSSVSNTHSPEHPKSSSNSRIQFQESNARPNTDDIRHSGQLDALYEVNPICNAIQQRTRRHIFQATSARCCGAGVPERLHNNILLYTRKVQTMRFMLSIAVAVCAFGVVSSTAFAANSGGWSAEFVPSTVINCNAQVGWCSIYAPEQMEVGGSCTHPNMVWDATTSAGKNVLSLLLSARLAGKTIIVQTQGCTSVAGSSRPLLVNVNLRD